MKLNFSQYEADALMELLYLGNWIANSMRQSDVIIDKYEELFLKIIRQLLPENKELDEEELYGKLLKVIEFYDRSILFSEFAKQYADYKYPVDLCELEKASDKAAIQYASNRILKDACMKELEKNGFKKVNIKLPDLNDEIKRKVDSLKN